MRSIKKNVRRRKLREWEKERREKRESAETESKHNGNGRVRTT